MLVLLKEISFIDRFLYQRRGRFDVLQMEWKKGVFTWGCTGKNSMIRTWCEHNSLLKSKISVISTVRCHHVCKTPEPWHFSPEEQNFGNIWRLWIFESRFGVWDCLRRKHETKSETETGWFMKNETDSESKTSLRTRVSVFWVRFSLFH